MKQPSKNLIYSNRDILRLVIPLIIELALQLIVGLFDSIMVSSVGEAAVSGVSLVDAVTQLIIYLFSALAAGGAIVAGQYLGAGRQTEAQRSAGELLWLNGLPSAAVMLLMLFLSEWILTHLFGHIEEDVAYNARRYLNIVIFSIPAIGLYEAAAAIFRTMNDSRTTMKLSLLMNIMNCMGNAVLIYGCSMGTQGAAFSTVVSRWVAAILAVGLLLNPRRELHIEKTWRHRFTWSLTRDILKMGVPSGAENGIFQLGKIVLLGLVTTFGTSAITANAVTQTLASLQVIPGSAIQLAMLSVISHCVGAKDYAQAKYYNRKLLLFAYSALAVWAALLTASLPMLLSIYHLSEETANLTLSLFLYHTAGTILIWPLSFDLPSALWASGDVRFTMVVSIVSMWVFRLGGAYWLANTLKLGVLGVWLAMAFLDWAFRSAAYLARWRSGKWKTKGLLISRSETA